MTEPSIFSAAPLQKEKGVSPVKETKPATDFTARMNAAWYDELLFEDESEKECVIRETAEETGLIISPSDCVLEIDEFYENCKYVNRYFLGRVTGKTALDLTARETEAGMEPRWATVEEILKICRRNIPGG